jgi:Mg2+/citrate symporter
MKERRLPRFDSVSAGMGGALNVKGEAMSTAAIVAIVIGALIVIAIAMVVARRARDRHQVATAQVEAQQDDARHHRERAEASRTEAAVAEERARRAQVEAELDEERATRREQELDRES